MPQRAGDVITSYSIHYTKLYDADLEFVEGLFFEDGRYFLMTGRFVDSVPQRDDIVRRSVFYRLVEQRSDIYLSTFDYIFRYDPDWFWNVPET